MAVTVDVATIGTGHSTSSQSFAFTPGATANAIYVAIGYNDVTDTVVSVTWNGATETFTSLFDTGPTSSAIAGFLLLNPTIKTDNIVVTWTGAIASGANAGAISLIGVDTSGGVAGAHRTIFSATGATTTPTVTVTDSVSGDLVIDTAICIKTAFTVDASQTSQVQDDAINGGSRSYGASTEVAAGSNTVMSWTIADAQTWVIRAFAFIADSGTGVRIGVGT